MSMKILVVIPTELEHGLFLEALARLGFEYETRRVGKIPVTFFPAGQITVAQGGLGKVQFAVHTQHLLDSQPDWDLVLCAGAAGALLPTLVVGDIIVATETVEHDIHNKFGKPRIPRFGGDPTSLALFRQVTHQFDTFRLHFAPVASGDEDVVEKARQQVLRERTGAVAVAWEGAGGAKACQFSGFPFIELRGISDGADSTAADDFVNNLPHVMKNLASLIVELTKQ